MHITLETDYAVRIVYCLACKRVRMDAKAISEETGVTLRFSLKILRKLVASGLVQSYKGTHGGYELARALEDLTLYDVLETVEGPYVFSRCVSPDFECSRRQAGCGPCKFQKIYNEISLEVQQRLRAVKFADLIDCASWEAGKRSDGV